MVACRTTEQSNGVIFAGLGLLVGVVGIALVVAGVVAGPLGLCLVGAVFLAGAVQTIWRERETASQLFLDPGSGVLRWRSLLGSGQMPLIDAATMKRTWTWGRSVYMIKGRNGRCIYFRLTSDEPEVASFFQALETANPKLRMDVLYR